MNKIFKSVEARDLQERRAKESPLAASVSLDVTQDYCPMKTQNLIDFRLTMGLQSWVDGGDDRITQEIKEQMIKRLHHHIFGNIESLLHELRLHFMREDYQDALKTLELIMIEINGDD